MEHPRIPPKEFDELLEKMTMERGLAQYQKTGAIVLTI